MDGRMTRDDIQRMALDAGFVPKELSRAMTDRLERFISLVAKETTSLCGTGALQADQQPYAWAVPPSNHIFRGEHAEHDAKREASCCGGTARAVPLYTAPQPVPADPADALTPADADQLKKAVTDFEEYEETDVPAPALLRFAAMGYLECALYHVMPKAYEAIDAARAAQEVEARPTPAAG